MPRPNQERSVHAELKLARRVALERERRGWTYKELAQRMEAAGCKIQISALHKLEKGDPPRRITFDEAVAYSLVFSVPLNELSADPRAVLSEMALDQVERVEYAISAMMDAAAALKARQQDYIEAMDAYTAFLEEHPEMADAIKELKPPERAAARMDFLESLVRDARTQADAQAKKAVGD